MWESRVLCEISKPLWKSVGDFHCGVISTAVGDHPGSQPAATDRSAAIGGWATWTL